MSRYWPRSILASAVERMAVLLSAQVVDDVPPDIFPRAGVVRRERLIVREEAGEVAQGGATEVVLRGAHVGDRARGQRFRWDASLVGRGRG